MPKNPKNKPLKVLAHWDAAAAVWWAESDDVPGLVTEAATLEELVENIRALVPDLLALNKIESRDAELPVEVIADRIERVRIRAD